MNRRCRLERWIECTTSLLLGECNAERYEVLPWISLTNSGVGLSLRVLLRTRAINPAVVSQDQCKQAKRRRNLEHFELLKMLLITHPDQLM